jgi:hypothetical protein
VPDSHGEWHDDDFCPPAPASDPSLAQLADRIRTQLQAGRSCFPMIEEVRLFVMARFYQVPPDSIVRELVGWGMEPSYAAELVASALATDRYDKRAEQARRIAAADDVGRPVDPSLAAMCQPAPSGARGVVGAPGLPDTCPECDRVLYPHARLLPTPSLGLRALLLLLAGAVLSAGTYWVGLAAIRSVIWIPMWALSLLWLPVALLPGLACGTLAYSFPRVARVRCRLCGWQSKIVLGRRRQPSA